MKEELLSKGTPIPSEEVFGKKLKALLGLSQVSSSSTQNPFAIVQDSQDPNDAFNDDLDIMSIKEESG